MHAGPLAQSDAEIKQAAQFYAHALVIDPHNAFAANGMGVLLAEKGHFLQARETFVQVRRTAAICVTQFKGGSRDLCDDGAVHTTAW